MPTTIAVVGGGPLGLMALKNLREDGFDATVYETREYAGGLWKPSTDDSLSIVENTIFNSSRFRTAATDFPVPEDMDDFPTGRQVYDYFNSYCDHFNLWPHIKFNSRIRTARRLDDRWELDIETSDGSSSKSESFDKVVFACGSFINPRQPKFESIENFKGEALHALRYYDPAKYKDQNVLVIGLHASAQDVVTGLSKHAKKVYISHRSGMRILPHYMDDGSVFDRQPSLGIFIIMTTLLNIFPTVFQWAVDSLLKSMSKKAFPDIPESWGFEPVNSTLVAVPLIGGQLYPHMVSGFAEPVPEVARIRGPSSIELKSGRVLDDIDTIIFCTGYDISIPVKFEPVELDPYPYPGALPNLYRNIFSLSPDPAVRNSVAFLGQVAAPFPGFAQYESIAMAVSQIWLGKSALPPLSEMQQWRRDFVAWREATAKKYGVSSTFYPVFVPMANYLIWLDQCAGLGIKKRLGLIERWTNLETWSLWWNDRKLYSQVLTGLCSPAIFRLFDEGKRKPWAGAREQIFLDNDAINRAQRERKRAMDKEKDA